MVDPDAHASSTAGGLSRRDLIKRGAVAGGLVWTAPLILDSLASPAGALTPTGGYPCSYITVVYTYGGSTYAAKFQNGANVCSDNTTSSDGSGFSSICDGVTYSNNCSGNKICANGSVIPADPSCASRVSYGGGTTINAGVGVTIIFAVAHDGSYQGTYGSKFVPICPSSPTSGNSITAPSCGS